MRNNFLKAVDLLHLAKQSGIRVVLNDDQLLLTFEQKKAIDRELLKEIKENKQVIVEYLANKKGKSNRVEKDYQLIDGSARTRMTHIPLSFSQERLWFIDQLEGSVQYHLPTVLRLKGQLNVEALEYALQQIVDRHEVLRTVIGSEAGEAYQYFKSGEGWHLQIEAEVIVDEKGLQQYINELIVQPFDLSSDYMLRANLVKVGLEEYVLVVTLHHIASDAWSVSVIVKEVVELYRAHEEGVSANLSALPIQYADYAIWQRNYLQGAVLEKKLGYWKDQLAGVTPLQLPLDYARPAIQSTRGAVSGFTVDKELSAQLQLLGQQQGTTMFMTLLSVFNVLLYRYSGQQDICVGTPIAGRQHQQVEELIGFFINTLALRSNLSDHPSFTSLLQQVRTTTLAAYDHQEIPFEKLVEVLVKERDRSRSPLFQVMFLLQNTPEVPALQLGDVQLSRESAAHHTAKFELTFNITQTSNGMQGAVEYCTDLFTEQTISRMILHFKALLQSVVASPSQQIGKLPMLSSEEEQQLLVTFNATGEAVKQDKTFIQLFEQQVSNTPDNIALVFGEAAFSYQQLNDRSNQLAHYLRSKGVGEEALVPVCIERSLDMVTAILGILKSGAAYVPVDPEYPADRIRYLLEDTGASVIVSNEKNKALLQNVSAINIISIDGDDARISEAPSANLSIPIGLHHLAYVIYTSGSTGKPKGVMIAHHNLMSYLLNEKTRYISKEPGNAGSFIHLSYTFDASLTGMFMPLLAGKSVVIGSNSSVDVFEESNLQKYAPYDFIKLTPAHLELLLPKMQLGNGSLLTKQLVIGGEALLLSQFNSFVEQGLNVHIVNEYGPTEATVGCSVYSFDTMGNNESMPNNISIGKPIDQVQLYILGDSEALVPVGVGGELCIAGAGVARGYLNRADLTAEKFVSNPFNAKAGTKMYKTGDLAKWLPDGNIEYLGRKDEQVKIRGYRIELGEIESVLNELAEVKQAVVLAKSQADGSKRLVAYIVPVDTFDKAAIVSSLSAKLPDYMVPVQWVSLESLPLTINGKVDRKGLPDPSISEQLSNAYVAPRNSLESKLVNIWQELLQIERIGVHDNFFELGGHSLLVMRLVSAIRKELLVETAIKSLFNHPTIAALAVHLEAAGEGTLLPSIAALPRPEHIPLSFSQERLWFIDQLEGSVQYHLPTVLRLKGQLNVEALELSLQQLIKRHEVLRTVIRENAGEGYQYIRDQNGWELKITEGAIYEQDQNRLMKYIRDIISLPFNLSEDYMLRAELIVLNDHENVLVVNMHHIASDGWSASVIVKDLMALYSAREEGKVNELSPLKIQYADYAIWQRNYLKGEILEKKLGYWRKQLEGVATLQLPTDYPRPVVRSTSGATSGFVLDETTTEKLRLFSQQQGTTMFMTLLAVFKVLLYRHSGQQDICVGIPIAGRHQQELESLVGFFINTLALRSEIDEEASFTTLLQQVRTTTLEAYDHQDVPFEKVVDAVSRERDMSKSPLFQVMFIMQNTPHVPDLSFGNVALEKVNFDNTSAKFDITFYIAETTSGLQGIMEYSSDLFSPLTIGRMLVHFKELINAVTLTPEKPIGLLTMLTSEEQQELLVDFNDTKTEYPEGKTLIGLFEEQVVKTPENIAVIFEDGQLTFLQLNELSNQFAHYLQGIGVKAGDLVPICIERSIDMVTGIFGILKAGAAYVPIDADYPEERIRFMLEDTGALIVVTNTASQPAFTPNGQLQVVLVDHFKDAATWPVDNLLHQFEIDSIVALTYTSGSSGKPKGVSIPNAGIVNRMYWMWATYPFGNNEVCALKTSIGFVDHMWELFGPLAKGVTTILFKKADLLDLDSLVIKLTDYKISRWVLVPSLLKVLLDKLQAEKISLPNLQYWTCSGEAISSDLIQDFYKQFPADKHKLLNIYGSSEVTADVTCYDTSLDFINALPKINGESVNKVTNGHPFNASQSVSVVYNKVPIGKPIANSQVFIVDKSGQLVAKGVSGEILVGGVQVAPGYLNLPKLTAEKFINNPFSKQSGNRLYSTGDLGCWLNDGNIAYLGRKDDQVKIRGYRIEPGEIEGVLLQSELVAEAVVLAKNDPTGSKRLVCYIVPNGVFDKTATQSYLKTRLPEFMIPSVWVVLERLPLTHNGKLNKKALPEPGASELVQRQYVAPGNELELNLVNIWQEILHIDRVGIHDNFFELGGHSLLVMRLVSAIRKELLVEIAVKSLFNYPTIAALAVHLEEAGEGVLLPSITALPRPEHIPLSFSQERLWFIDQLEGSVQYHLPTILRLKGKLNLDGLVFSLKQLINRHEVLRTVIRDNAGEGYQYIKDQNDWEIKITEGTSYEQDEEGLMKYIRHIISLPFNLSEDFMFRAELIVLNDQENVLVVNMHHIASDGWSASVIVKDLMASYSAIEEGKTNHLSPLKIQYADYAIWQRNYLKGEVLEKKLDYWRKQLEGVATLQLPTDYPRPVAQSTKGATSGFVLDEAITEKLRLFSQQQGTTMFMTLLAVVKVLLFRYTGQVDICVGTPIAGRQQHELENLIGFFVNTLALRTTLSSEIPFTDLLQQIRTETLEAYDNQEVPFEKVVESVVKNRDMGRSPLFQVMFVLQNTPEVPELSLNDVKITRGENQHTTALFDLTFFITESEHGLRGFVEYKTNLFGEITISRMIRHFTELLSSIATQPQQKIGCLTMISKAEEAQLLTDFNNTITSWPENKTIINLFEEQASVTPLAVAVVFDDEELTYQQLNVRSNQLAHYLIENGIKPGTRVPINIERSIEMIISVLAVLKAGGVYVPVDPDYPRERISYMLEDTNALLIISTSKSKINLPVLPCVTILEIDGVSQHAISTQPENNLSVKFPLDHLVYVIYTSGSTGRPKGVKMGGRGMVNLLYWQEKQFTNKHRRVLQFASLNFDVSFQEIFSTLCFGSSLYLISGDRRRDMSELLKDVAKYKLTHLFFPFIVLKTLVEFLDPLTLETFPVEEIIVAGEQLKLTEDIQAMVKKTGVRIINQYGPTEAHVVSSYAINAGDNLPVLPPIGKPIDNMQLYILSDLSQPVPVGVAGELFIGGVQVAQGYLNLPDLTKEKFVEDTFSIATGNRLYKTGDLARWLPDGNIEYLGRKDDQVKIRGYRVELGEIEAVLQECGLVRQAVVLAREDGIGNRQLVGYVVPERKFDKQGIIAFLKMKLPEFMVPALLVELDQLPVTRNGKINRGALPGLQELQLLQQDFIRPRCETETRLAECWEKLLKINKIGINDNFFELGGHSLLAIRLVFLINKNFCVNLSISQVFLNPTIAGMAPIIAQQLDDSAPSGPNHKYLVQLKAGTPGKPALYIVCGGGGSVVRFREFVKMLDDDQPVFALQSPIDLKDIREFPDNIEKMATTFIKEILTNNPTGPYALSGHCLGGIIAFEMAKQLKESGKEIQLLAMFDTIIRNVDKRLPVNRNPVYQIVGVMKIKMLRLVLKLNFETFLFTKHTRKAIKYKINAISKSYNKVGKKIGSTKESEFVGLEVFDESAQVYINAARKYKLTPYEGGIILFFAKEHYYFMDKTMNITYGKQYLSNEIKNMWKFYAHNVKIHDVEGEHSEIFDLEQGNEFARLVQYHLNIGSND